MTTLREQAAIAAMQGLLGHGLTTLSPCICASDAVGYADALLAELERTAPTPAADATRLTCTAAERELIEAMVRWDGTGWGTNFERREDFYIAHYKVLDERRAAKETKP